MVAFFLLIALVTPGHATVAAHAPRAFVVQFCSHSNPAQTARDLQRLQKAGLKEIRAVSSPFGSKQHVYRVVSRRFATYAEARLALVDAHRLLRKARLPFRGVVLDADRAGAPLIR